MSYLITAGINCYTEKEVFKYCTQYDSTTASGTTMTTLYYLFFHGATAPSEPWSLYYQGFTITLSRTSLDERSTQNRELYLTTHNTHKRQTSMPLVGFEPTIPASEW